MYTIALPFVIINIGTGKLGKGLLQVLSHFFLSLPFRVPCSVVADILFKYINVCFGVYSHL